MAGSGGAGAHEVRSGMMAARSGLRVLLLNATTPSPASGAKAVNARKPPVAPPWRSSGPLGPGPRIQARAMPPDRRLR